MFHKYTTFSYLRNLNKVLYFNDAIIEYTDVMKKKIALLLISTLLASTFLLTSCGSKSEMSVEDEVYERLQEAIPPIDETTGNISSAGSAVTGDSGSNTGADQNTAVPSVGPAQNTASDDDGDKTSSPTATARGGSSAKTTEAAKNVNPFLGDTSTSTVFNIKFSIETDSGVAGITFGSTDGTKGEYYLFAFDCTRDIPMLYTSRRNEDAVYDEEYTNLDFMYPEMVMFTGVEHIVEIKVSGNIATTYLDSYKVCDTTLKSAKACGQIGTWVMDGNYHEYIDNLFVAEGYEGDGEWIYSDDFARTSNLFYPDLKPRSGRLYASTGYYTAPHKEK